MEISAVEILTSAKLEVNRALDTANATLHRSQEEALQPTVESEAVTKAAALQGIENKRGLHRGVRERHQRKGHQWQVAAEAAQSTIRAKRLSGRREGRGPLRQHNSDSMSEIAALSFDRPQERRSHCVHCRRENRRPQRKHEGR